MPHAGRDTVRSTARKVLRSDDLIAGEKDAAIAILRASPQIGSPYAVRCDWCRETRTLFNELWGQVFSRLSRVGAIYEE